MVFGAFRKLGKGLAKTRDQVRVRLAAAIQREVYLDEDFVEEVEEILISADVGVDAAVRLAEGLGKELRQRGGKADLDDVSRVLGEQVREMLGVAASEPPELSGPPHVVLVVGVNGVGKTTTIAKLARWHMQQGRKVLLAAGDTFRAAAIEQLTTWSERLGCEIVAQEMGADPAAVAFDALARAKAQGADVLIVDTAGRLQNKEGLMRELAKVARVMEKQLEGAPHEVLLCLDANTGQNGISQAREFHAATRVDAIVLTKLDGSAKGGIVVAIAQELDLPVRYVGTGEQLDDFAPFEPDAFALGLFDPERLSVAEADEARADGA